ncbi:ribose-5-phosphate isomerase RpiA (plasmid) [Polymorphobacter sp. PAMC 29334]|uniref:ribose-5-phosphate isomerase RpiA n=1 Tax=Polymorphobacter sp. PAMC 29334 TaxID=2862331 RepID=UPI001C758341|nr:ribose-5-phosphate isomerase RpiA [Polymorphobacter sp. PAMC 29334]QYE33513.1 ribose-5-phosphate isomerase RpiA [Polymorphobacter sp. PAMC 29334]
MNDAATFKQQAGEAAAALVEPGMVVGLGTGTTAIFAIRRIAARWRGGELPGLVAVATSTKTAVAAQALGILLLGDDMPRAIDLVIDGADEVDPALDLIKGAGGALVREKIVAQASDRVVIVVDASKVSDALGSKALLPIEVLAWGWEAQLRYLTGLGATVTAREADGRRYLTDGGNMILDCGFGTITDPAGLAATLETRAGIAGHGLFVEIADDVFVAGPAGVEHRRRSRTG